MWKIRQKTERRPQKRVMKFESLEYRELFAVDMAIEPSLTSSDVSDPTPAIEQSQASSSQGGDGDTTAAGDAATSSAAVSANIQAYTSGGYLTIVGVDDADSRDQVIVTRYNRDYVRVNMQRLVDRPLA